MIDTDDYTVSVGKDGIYTVSGTHNGRPWVSYGQSLEEALAHADLSKRTGASQGKPCEQ